MTKPSTTYTIKDTDNLAEIKAVAKGTSAGWFVFSPATDVTKRLFALGLGAKVPPDVLEHVQTVAASRNAKVFVGTTLRTDVPGGRKRVFKPKGTEAKADLLLEAVEQFTTKATVRTAFPEIEADVYFDPSRMRDAEREEADARVDPKRAKADEDARQTDRVTAQASAREEEITRQLQAQVARAKMAGERIKDLLGAVARRDELAHLADQAATWRDERVALLTSAREASEARKPLVKLVERLEALEGLVRAAITAKPPRAPVQMKDVSVADLERAVGDEVATNLQGWAAVADPLAVQDGSLGDLRTILRGLKSWELAKKHERAHDLFAYRKEIVDKTLSELRKKHKGLVWKSVGSMSWSSDYDITVATPDGGKDTAVVREFNDRIKAVFGVQPGTLFDTNLYVRDYADVVGKDAGKLGGDANVVKNSPRPKVMQAMMQAGQDMGALMKQRRYMSASDWDAYMRGTLGDIERETVANAGGELDAEGRVKLDQFLAATRKQFEEADANYQLAAQTLHAHTAALAAKDKDKVVKRVQALAEVALELDETCAAKIHALATQVAKAATAETWTPLVQQAEALAGEAVEGAQEDAAKSAAAFKVKGQLAEQDADSTLEASNLLYLDGMDQVRELEKRAMALFKEADEKEEEAKTATPQDGIDIASLLTMRASNARAQAESAMQVARTKAAEAIFFAAEAYHTQGAVEHIVAGVQGSKLTPEEERAAREGAGQGATDEARAQAVKKAASAKLSAALDKVDPWSILQSFNENMGDFMKDLKHYGHVHEEVEDDGEALVNIGKLFVKGSKYLERMFDCVDVLKGKLGLMEPLPFERDLKGAQQLQREIQQSVLLVRKGAKAPTDADGVPLEGAAAEEAADRYAAEKLREIFGTGGLANLEKIVVQITRDVNSWVRRAIQQAEIHAGRGQEHMYFKAATK